jgi:hypothetical protein
MRSVKVTLHIHHTHLLLLSNEVGPTPWPDNISETSDQLRFFGRCNIEYVQYVLYLQYVQYEEYAHYTQHKHRYKPRYCYPPMNPFTKNSHKISPFSQYNCILSIRSVLLYDDDSSGSKHVAIYCDYKINCLSDGCCYSFYIYVTTQLDVQL